MYSRKLNLKFCQSTELCFKICPSQRLVTAFTYMNPQGLKKKNHSSPNNETLTIFYVALDAILINDLTIALLR